MCKSSEPVGSPDQYPEEIVSKKGGKNASTRRRGRQVQEEKPQPQVPSDLNAPKPRGRCANGYTVSDAPRSPSPPPSTAGKAEETTFSSLARVLTQMAKNADPSELATPCSFASARPPQVSLTSYASRIRKFFRCTDECFVLCLVYIDRIVHSHSDIQVNDLTCHRMLLVGTMIAAKFHDDEYAANSYYAKVGGIETSELNALEAEFLKALNFKLFVTGKDFDWYLTALRQMPKA